MDPVNWKAYQTSYRELSRRGVSHDTASDKALYLSQRGALPQVCNWGLIAKHCKINEASLARNTRCVSLFTPLGRNDNGQAITTLMDTIPAPPAHVDPERIAIVHDELSRVPDSILQLFVGRDRPLTNAECVRIHRFREANVRIR